MYEPLFILCPGRSFSSVVCAVIGQHPDAFGLPEVHLFFGDKVGDLLDLETPLLGVVRATTGLKRAVAELAFNDQSFETIEKTTEWCEQRRDITGAALFSELCDLSGNRLVVDKSPTNSHPESLERIYKEFPNAKFLHLSRHPRATCRSQHKALTNRKGWRAKKKFDHENYWFLLHNSILEFSERLDPGQYMFMQGESFFEFPELFLKQICQWLGLSTDPEAIAQMMKPELSPFAVMGPENAKYGNNVGFMEKPHLRVGKIRPEILDGPLDWITDEEIYFSDQTRSLAYQLGYDS